MPSGATTSEFLPNGAILVNENIEYVVSDLINKGGFSFIYNAFMKIRITSNIGGHSIDNYISEEVVIKELFIPTMAYRNHGDTWINWKDETDRGIKQSKSIKQKTISEAIKLSGLRSNHILKIYAAFEQNNTVSLAF